MDAINCPYCGAAVQEREAGNKVWQCSHCSHSLLLESRPAIQAIQSTTDSSALITLGSSFKWREQRYTTYGFLSFSHSEGVRTEWLLKDDEGEDYYLIADDENFFLLQSEGAGDLTSSLTEGSAEVILNWESLQPNTHFSHDGKDWLVTEQRRMTLVQATENAALSQLQNGSRNDTYLIAENAETLMLIFTGEVVTCRQGFWLDPFEIRGCA